MEHNIAVLKAKYRILKELEHAAVTRADISLVIRHMKAAARNQAYNELLQDEMIESDTKVTFRPGKNPQLLRITKSGRDELKRLTKEYK